MKKLILALFSLGVMGAGMTGIAAAEAKLKVVASTVYFEDLVKRIGGDRVEAAHVAPPRFNIHFIQPRPSDVRNVSRADLFVFAGLDLEAWADPLLEASGNRKVFRGAERNVDMSAGIPLLKVPAALDRAQGDVHAHGNPHYTLNPEHLKTMAATLTAKLKEADPAGAAVYEANLERFELALEVKLAEWRSAVSGLRGKEIVAYHDDVAYLADFAGLKSEVFVEPKPGIPPSPKHLQFLQEYLPAQKVSGILSATYYPKGTLRELSGRTGVPVVEVPQSPGEVPGTEDVLTFFDHIFKTLRENLG
jgi:zinc/manganese transport system substrate-binding protein